jgi:hypothetical protein
MRKKTPASWTDRSSSPCDVMCVVVRIVSADFEELFVSLRIFSADFEELFSKSKTCS